MPINPRTRPGICQDMEGAADDIGFGHPLTDPQHRRFHFRPAIEFLASPEAGVVFAGPVEALENYLPIARPLIDQAILIFLDLPRNDETFPSPARSLLEGSIVVDDRVLNARRRQLQQ